MSGDDETATGIGFREQSLGSCQHAEAAIAAELRIADIDYLLPAVPASCPVATRRDAPAITGANLDGMVKKTDL